MFDEVRFPVDISYGSAGGPGYKTEIVELQSGAEQRVSRWGGPRHRYNVVYGVREYPQLSELKEFYLARRGAAAGFRFKDWQDYATTFDGRTPDRDGWGTVNPTNVDEALVPVNGTTTFQLAKRYTSGLTTITRSIAKPVASTILIARNGVAFAAGGNWSLDDTTGLITFNASQAGQTMTWGGEFDVPVRFSKSVDDVLMTDLSNFGSGSAQSIELVEVVDDGGTEDAYNYGGSAPYSLSADLSLSVSRGRFIRLTAPGAGRSVILPNPSALQPGGPYWFVAIEAGSNTITLKDHLGATIRTMAASKGVTVLLGLDSLGVKFWSAIGG